MGFYISDLPKSRIEEEVKRQSCKTCSECASSLFGISMYGSSNQEMCVIDMFGIVSLENT